MEIGINLTKQARALPYDTKKDYLLSLPETELHKELKSLFEKMEDKCLVEITHGPDEFGRDLVIKRQDPYGEYFVGVVVKKGDSSGKITGKTAGVIDDVISQANQAFTNRCTLREIQSGSVSISEVLVIFAGRLTGGASKRIEAQLQQASIRVFVIGWLVDKFAEYYPQVFLRVSWQTSFKRG